MKNNENLDAEQVVNLVQQSFCAVGSAFQSLNTHRKKRFQGCLTKEFRSLADKQPNKSEPALSPWLFGSNLEEQLKSKLDSSTISRKVISREITRFEPIRIKIRIEIFPTPRVGEKKPDEKLREVSVSYFSVLRITRCYREFSVSHLCL